VVAADAGAMQFEYGRATVFGAERVAWQSRKCNKDRAESYGKAMMSSLITRVTRVTGRNVRSFVPQALAMDDRAAEIEIFDDALELTV
jgi:hypothetical protein